MFKDSALWYGEGRLEVGQEVVKVTVHSDGILLEQAVVAHVYPDSEVVQTASVGWTPAYGANYDSIFGKKDEDPPSTQPVSTQRSLLN